MRHRWPCSRVLLAADNLADLRMKARCVLSENLLSVRAQQLGAQLRSPYYARNGRARIRSTLQFLEDRWQERRFFRRLAKTKASAG